jgi:hypothetical protein
MEPHDKNPFSHEQEIKWVATEEGRDLADLLSATLVVLGYDVAVSHDNATYMFPAKPDQQLGTTLRCPPAATTRLALTIESAFLRAQLRCDRVIFPKSQRAINSNYIQIEIGGYSLSDQWS